MSASLYPPKSVIRMRVRSTLPGMFRQHCAPVKEKAATRSPCPRKPASASTLPLAVQPAPGSWRGAAPGSPLSLVAVAAPSERVLIGGERDVIGRRAEDRLDD